MTPDKFKETRIELGLSQGALGKELGRSKSIVSQWESGQVPIPKYAVIIINKLIENKLYNGKKYDDYATI